MEKWMKPSKSRINNKRSNNFWSVPTKVSKKQMSYHQAKTRYPKLNPYGDADKDGVPNWLDCRPFNKHKQGFLVPLTKKSGRRYETQIKRIAERLSTQFEEHRRYGEEIGRKWHNRPDIMEKKLRRHAQEAQPETTGAFDFMSIPGAVKQLPENVMIVPYGKKSPMNTKLALVVEKGVVKGSVVTKPRTGATEIKTMYILPEYRKQGVGTKVVSAIMKNPKVESVVGVAIPKSKQYWEKIGGVKTGSPGEEEAEFEHQKQTFEPVVMQVGENAIREGRNPMIEVMKFQHRLATDKPFREKMNKMVEESGTPFTITKKDFQKHHDKEDVYTMKDFEEVYEEPKPETIKKMEELSAQDIIDEKQQ